MKYKSEKSLLSAKWSETDVIPRSLLLGDFIAVANSLWKCALFTHYIYTATFLVQRHFNFPQDICNCLRLTSITNSELQMISISIKNTIWNFHTEPLKIVAHPFRCKGLIPKQMDTKKIYQHLLSVSYAYFS